MEMYIRFDLYYKDENVVDVVNIVEHYIHAQKIKTQMNEE